MRPWVVLSGLLLPFAAHAAPDLTTYGYTPAPVPNQELSAPIYLSPAGPTLFGSLNQTRVPLRSGDGFTPGSNFSAELERRPRATGGIVPGFVPTLGIKFPLR